MSQIKFDDLANRILQKVRQNRRLRTESIKNPEEPLWHVYGLINHTQKEIYFGISNNPERRYGEHADKNTKSTEHWKFGKDSVKEFYRSGETYPFSRASEIAHVFEDEWEYDGYAVIKTTGP